MQSISFLIIELDSVNLMASLTNGRTQSVLNCLKMFKGKTAVPLKQFQRLLEHMIMAALAVKAYSAAYGIDIHGPATWIDAYETAIALATQLSPEMALRHTPCDHHTDLSPIFQPLVRTCFFRTSVQARCYNRCLQN